MNGSISHPSETPTTNMSAQNVQPKEQETQSHPSDEDVVTKTKEARFPVIELFGPVIQGEGSQAGQQTMFIRFGGCDSRCTKCDSLHAVIPQAIQKHRTMMSIADIVKQLEVRHDETGVKWVTFSGGNPVMWELTELIEALHKEGWLINVETQGTLWKDWLNLCDVITVSPKSMGMGEMFDPIKYEAWIDKVRRPLCVKVVVFTAQDFEMALWVEALTRVAIADQCLLAFYLSLGNPYPPVLDEDFNLVDNPEIRYAAEDMKLSDRLLRTYRELSEEVLLDRRLKNWKFLPQLHVLVYGNEAGK